MSDAVNTVEAPNSWVVKSLLYGQKKKLFSKNDKAFILIELTSELMVGLELSFAK